jgi:hypothetical protein
MVCSHSIDWRHSSPEINQIAFLMIGRNRFGESLTQPDLHDAAAKVVNQSLQRPSFRDLLLLSERWYFLHESVSSSPSGSALKVTTLRLVKGHDYFALSPARLDGRQGMEDVMDQPFPSPTYGERDAIEKPRFYKTLPAVPSLVNGNGHGNGVKGHGATAPPPKLERITEGSVPISLIFDRVIRRSYGEFLNLAETCALLL